MMKNLIRSFAGTLVGIALVFATQVHAATFSLTPSAVNVGTNAKVAIDIKIDGEGAGFNAGQATINFPKDRLQVVLIEKTGSAFSFWLQEPVFSNDNGTVAFIGGTPYGVSGSSIQALRIVFTTKGSGKSDITITDAAVTSSDGSGANILGKINNAVVTVSQTATSPTPLIPTPQQIVRKAAPAVAVPSAPKITIPLYPSGEEWYGAQSIFTVNLDLPADITGVQTAINKQPRFIPNNSSEGLFDSKTFAPLTDGVWYLHVRYQNSNGWGPTTHRRIAIDTEPSAGFSVKGLEGESTDVPTPTFGFQTTDSLSGLKEYQVRVDDSEVVRVSADKFSGNYVLSAQTPGKHVFSVRAVDMAGNSIENSVPFSILPIESPVITYITGQLFIDQQEGLGVKGTAIPGTKVQLSLQSGVVLYTVNISVDNKGSWGYTFNDPLKEGTYFVTARTEDNRGALSLVVKSTSMSVKGRPVVQFGNFSLDTQGAVGLFLLILVIGFGGGFLFYKKRGERVALRASVVQGDVSKALNVIKADIAKIEEFKKDQNAANMEYYVSKTYEDIKKMEGYLVRGVGKIK